MVSDTPASTDTTATTPDSGNATQPSQGAAGSDAANATNPDDADTADAVGNGVNPQILDAVQNSTDFAFGLKASLIPPVPNGTRLSSGAAIAFDKAAQAAALSVQDASDYVRNVMSVAAVAQGKALAEILAGVNVSNAKDAISQATAAVTAAVAAVAALGAAQTAMLNAFPRG